MSTSVHTIGEQIFLKNYIGCVIVKSETKTTETEELAKAIALELEKQTPENAEAILDEHTRRLHGSGDSTDDSGTSEDSQP